MAFAVALVPAVAYAGGASRAADVARLEADAGGAASVQLLNATASPRFVRLDAGLTGFDLRGPASPEDVALAFFAEYADAFGVDAAQLKLEGVDTDALGATRVVFRQHRGDVPVLGAELRVHFDATGDLVAVHGHASPGLTLAPTPTLPMGAAETAALGSTAGGRTAGARLVVFDARLLRPTPRGPRLAWEVEVVASADVHDLVYVDAHTGLELERIAANPSVMTRRGYHGSHDAAGLVWEEGDPPYAGGDIDVAHVIDYTQDTYDFFDHLSGGMYLSYDASSAVLDAVADAPLSCPNARWDGDATLYCDGVTGDDVVGHEWAHAYTQFTHHLIYHYQAGALNESYSDIFGELIDQLNDDGTDEPDVVREVGACAGGTSVRWLIGEDATAFANPIRDMWTPSCRNQPNAVFDDDYWCSIQDNGGVHVNSGIPNRAFALLVDGGTVGGVPVASIGATKAAHIYWRAMTTYQTEASNFADHADALASACDDLDAAGTDLTDLGTGAPSGEVIDADDCAAVDAAMSAVGMAQVPGCDFGTVLDPATPPLCDNATITEYVEDFEAEPAGWSVFNQGSFPEWEPRDWEWRGDLPDGRGGSAYFALGDSEYGNCGTDVQAGRLQLDGPEILLPADATLPILGFDHWFATEVNSDGGRVQVSVNGGAFQTIGGAAFMLNAYNTVIDGDDNPLAGSQGFSGVEPLDLGGTWARSRVSLVGIAVPGDTIQLRFEFGVDGCSGIVGWFVDDVSLRSCSELCEADDQCEDFDPCTAGTCGPDGLCVYQVADSDGDGALDCEEECPDDPDKLEPGVCGCGSPDVDGDGDGALDCVDPCPQDNPDDPDGDGDCGEGSGETGADDTGGDDVDPDDDDDDIEDEGPDDGDDDALDAGSAGGTDTEGGAGQDGTLDRGCGCRGGPSDGGRAAFIAVVLALIARRRRT